MKGIFQSLSKRLRKVKEEARNYLYRKIGLDFPVKLVEPSSGLVVEVEVTETDKYLVDTYMRMIVAYAKSIEPLGVKWEKHENVVRFEFEDADMAEAARDNWKR